MAEVKSFGRIFESIIKVPGNSHEGSSLAGPLEGIGKQHTVFFSGVGMCIGKGVDDDDAQINIVDLNPSFLKTA